MPAILPAPLTGIFPPLVTPLKNRDALDLPAFERLIEHVIAGGVHGVFLLGTTGEGPGLSHRLRAEVVEHGCRVVGGRVPVLVGVTDTSFVESVRLGERAADAGASAVVVAPPHYFPISQGELISYVDEVAAVMPLPVLLYHIPSMTKVGFEPDTVRQLMNVPKVIGLKDSGRDMHALHLVRQFAVDRPDFSILVGPEELLAEAVLLGAHGGMCGGANMFPKLYVELFQAAQAGDLARARPLHEIVMAVSSALYTVGPATSSYFRGIKCAMSLLGLCDNVLAEPYVPFAGDDLETIRQRLVALGTLTDSRA
jgi:dihydrodipicolinate synthase/N-acetylneuraminate lyase